MGDNKETLKRTWYKKATEPAESKSPSVEVSVLHRLWLFRQSTELSLSRFQFDQNLQKALVEI